VKPSSPLFNNAEGAKQEPGWAVLVSVGDEFTVKVLVSGEGDSSGLLVFLGKESIESFIDVLDVRGGGAADTVQAVLAQADDTVTVNVNGFEVVGDESFEGRGELGVFLAGAVGLDGLLEFFNGNFLVLVEIGEFSNLFPEGVHDFFVAGEQSGVPFAFALDEGNADSQAVEVVLVQEAVVIKIVHVPDDELDTVFPGVSHFVE